MCYTFTFLVMWRRHGLFLPCFRVIQHVPYIFVHDKLLLPSIVQVGTLCLWRKALCLTIETKNLVPLMKRWVWTQELKQEFGPVLFPSLSWYVLPVISKPLLPRRCPALFRDCSGSTSSPPCHFTDHVSSSLRRKGLGKVVSMWVRVCAHLCCPSPHWVSVLFYFSERFILFCGSDCNAH